MIQKRKRRLPSVAEVSAHRPHIPRSDIALALRFARFQSVPLKAGAIMAKTGRRGIRGTNLIGLTTELRALRLLSSLSEVTEAEFAPGSWDMRGVDLLAWLGPDLAVRLQVKSSGAFVKVRGTSGTQLIVIEPEMSDREALREIREAINRYRAHVDALIAAGQGVLTRVTDDPPIHADHAPRG